MLKYVLTFSILSMLKHKVFHFEIFFETLNYIRVAGYLWGQIYRKCIVYTCMCHILNANWNFRYYYKNVEKHASIFFYRIIMLYIFINVIYSIKISPICQIIVKYTNTSIWASRNILHQKLNLTVKTVLILCFVQLCNQTLVLCAIFSR